MSQTDDVPGLQKPWAEGFLTVTPASALSLLIKAFGLQKQFGLLHQEWNHFVFHYQIAGKMLGGNIKLLAENLKSGNLNCTGNWLKYSCVDVCRMNLISHSLKIWKCGERGHKNICTQNAFSVIYMTQIQAASAFFSFCILRSHVSKVKKFF